MQGCGGQVSAEKINAQRLATFATQSAKNGHMQCGNSRSIGTSTDEFLPTGSAAVMSALAPIVLQKSFCALDHKISEP